MGITFFPATDAELNSSILEQMQFTPFGTTRPLTEPSGKASRMTKPDIEIEKSIFSLCQDNNWYISELTPVQTRLEDIFRKVTQNG